MSITDSNALYRLKCAANNCDPTRPHKTSVYYRLRKAYMNELMPLQPKDFQDTHARRLFTGIIEDLTWFHRPKLNVGALSDTLSIMDIDEAKAIAVRICDLYNICERSEKQ